MIGCSSLDFDRTYPKHAASTASRVIEGQATVVQARESEVHILNPVGTRCWELADGTRSLSEIVAAICDEFEVGLAQAQADVEAFVSDLAARDLLMLVEGSAQGAPR